ncbi:hypothetical protein TBLA_0C02880 [Henningerozyma blattae CBS 6284]|uniref:tRNA ligase n=1 Tax=Henningerozyma blattae (strain ATCC 34711 / CBS 6284 / DSM 70876 / NBRC 10599 / NRRL Y-10934 / UCD 77-7) TaxID=1071380 RepID=I2H141_HENB6|nr:hypothetical protein TBLA_0C02880 [Tetrapisispora blattae CBS 6284]CCH60093.1 hypothetical protein TBLA_0C02880 [Tetrapisispora blattae CBS 6284]
MISAEEDVKHLVKALYTASELPSRGKSYSIQCNLFHSDQKVISWKFNEWDYGKNNIVLPCEARGLFISDDKENPRIIARGYDKFFSIDEVAKTKWDWIEKETKGPYEVTLKTNGCIIFISGLEDGSLVVCSKHSTGPRDDVNKNHAEAGELKLVEQLEKIKIDPKTLGAKLYENDITAVAEYCDDSFEEHILAYKDDSAGLYLHGINLNKPNFETWPINKVQEFGENFGFKPTEYVIKEDIKSLKSFLDNCSKTGSYNSKEVEGFVIRTHLFLDNSDFFFKFKFEEPYLMYRQWREVTKDYICTKSRVSRFKKHKFITNKYLDYVIPILDSDPILCEHYMSGFGIIELRNMFLKSYGMTGMEILSHEKLQELELKNAINYDKIDENTKFLIFPVAVIGCGKTTTALTLQNLFPKSWGVVQNDDITGKDKSELMKRSLALLSKPGMKCVVVDRNNHQFRERKELFSWLDELKEDYLPYDTNIKVIAWSFATIDSLDIIKEITKERILQRGDNHQSIKLNEYGEQKTFGIMSGFWKRLQPINSKSPPDEMFDLIIELTVSKDDSSLKNAKTVAQNLHLEFPILMPTIPTDLEFKEAFDKALSYKPTVRKNVGNNNKRNGKDNSYNSVNKKSVRKPNVHAVYYSATIAEQNELINTVVNLISESDINLSKKTSLLEYFDLNKYQREFHITLSHVSSAKNGTQFQKDMWSRYQQHYKPILKKLKDTPIKENVDPNASNILSIDVNDTLKFKLDKLYFDDKIMTATVKVDSECIYDPKGKLIPGLGCSNTVPHITVCILLEGTKPFYSNTLCDSVLANGVVDGIYCIKFNDPKEYNAAVRINL